VTLELHPDTVCIHTPTFELSGGSPLGGKYSGPGVSDGDFDPSAAGVGMHTITYTYWDGYCSVSKTAPIIVEVCTGLESTPPHQAFVVYPNPFSGQAVLESDHPLQNATLTIENCLGQTVMQIKNINGRSFTLSRSNLPAGIYFIHLTEKNNVITTLKIVISD
jgi:hypothetical protein